MKEKKKKSSTHKRKIETDNTYTPFHVHKMNDTKKK